MATETFVDFTGLQYYDGKLKEKIASEYAKKSELPSSYQGATSSANGVAGLVPAAPSADREKFLRGDGTWEDVFKEVSYSTTEPTSSSIASLDNESVIFYETQSMSSGANSPAPISITGNAATASSVGHSMSISVDGGAVEGASLYTFNGSAEKTVNIAGGTGISLTGVSGTVTINANSFRGATASVNGAAGSVPAPMVAEKDMFLRGDGTWATVSLPDVYQGATSSSSGIAGLVPVASSAERERFLKGDGTWAEVVQPAIVTSSELSTGTDATVRTISPKVIHDYVAGVDSSAVHITGNETIAGVKTFSSTISGSIDGNAVTATKATQDASGNVITTTYATKNELPSDYVGATANANGVHGLVPAAPSVDRDKFLKGDGTWAEVVQPAIVTSSELSTGTDATVRTISPKVIHDYVAGEVASGVAGLVNSAPATLDTLNELAAALGNDANFATTVATNIGTKLDASSANYVKSLSKDGQNLVYTKGNDTTQSISLVLGVVKNIAIETSDVEMVDNNTAISTLIIQPTSEVLQKLSTYCNSSSSLSKQFIYDGTSFSGTDEVPSTWNSKVSVEINKRSTYWTIKAEPTVKSISNSQYDTPTAFEMPFGEHTIDVGLFDSPVFTRISYTLENDSIQFTHYDLYSKDLSTKQCVKLLVTNDNNTTSRLDLAYVGATDERSSRPGLVPSAFPSEKDCFLCGDGTWDAISGMTNAQIDTAMANVGYVDDIDPSLLTSITNAEIDALFA